MTGTAESTTLQDVNEEQKKAMMGEVKKFTDRMLEEFGSMNWSWSDDSAPSRLKGDALTATTFHAVLLSSAAVMIAAGCPVIRIRGIVIGAFNDVIKLERDMRSNTR